MRFRKRAEAEPREPRLRPRRVVEEGRKVSALEAEHASKLELARQAQKLFEEDRAQSFDEKSRYPNRQMRSSAPLEVAWKSREAEGEETLQALVLAKQRLENAEADAPSREQLLDLQDQLITVMEEFNAALRVKLETQERLVSLRDRALRVLGRGHAIVDWPVGALDKSGRRDQLWLDAPSIRPERWLR